MSESVMPPTDEVGSLLGDRERIQGWLARLDGAVGSTPEAVRQRVRADYEQRLAEVVTRLGTHVASLSASLATASTALAASEAERSELEESLAEAELRHAVGEYPDDQWEALAATHRARLEVLSANIETLAAEVDRTSDLLARITASASPSAMPQVTHMLAVAEVEVVLSADLPPSVAEPERALQVEVGDDGIPVFERPEPGVRRLPEPVIMHAPLEAPKFRPSAASNTAPPGPAREIQFPVIPVRSRRETAPPEDELAFLRSVTADSAETRPKQAPAGTERTLQCADCGAMNPPNEWYCDQCGGELSTL